MKRIILIFSLMLFTAITFAQTGCVYGDCQNDFSSSSPGVTRIYGEFNNVTIN